MRTQLGKKGQTWDLIRIEYQHDIPFVCILKRHQKSVALHRRTFARARMRCAERVHLDNPYLVSGPGESPLILSKHQRLRSPTVGLRCLDQHKDIRRIEVLTQTMLQQVQLAVEEKGVEDAYRLLHDVRDPTQSL